MALAWALLAGSAAAQCRQALALALDVSGSVDEREYRLQLDGLAGALMTPEVAAAFLAIPERPVRLSVYEWAGLGSQRVLVDWVEIVTRADLESIAARLTATPRIAHAPPTALGQAMLIGARQLERQRNCDRLTLDISGDGQSNTGPRPREVRRDPRLALITVNALVIGSDQLRHDDHRQDEIGALWAYFQSEVIHWPGAFVEVALGFEDFQAAMARKLLRELQTLVVGDLGHRPARQP